MSFGTTLRKLRKEQQLTQTELSKQTCIPQTTISGWERGESYPSVIQVQKLSKALGVKISELLESA